MTLYRNATFDELSEILSWAANEGWNPGVEDVAPFWLADPEGFFVAEVDGQLAAAISVVNHTTQYAFLGLYIAKPAFRGTGIGHALWRHAIQHAGSRVVGLDGVPDQQANYAASGFELAGATTRFTGAVAAKVCDRVCQATPQDLATLVKLEGDASGVSKPSYLQAWLRDAKTRHTYVIRDGAEIRAFCTVRACENGAKIGPLWASNKEDALPLMSQAAEKIGSVLTVDVPDKAPVLQQLCTDLGMEAGFETARMYRGSEKPDSDKTPACFAVTSLELG